MSELQAYEYELPRESIAQEPLAERSEARLLVVDRKKGTLTHRQIKHLPEYIAPSDCLVLNDTRVIPARLVGKRTATEGRWEGLFLRVDPETQNWLIIGTTRGKILAGETVTVAAQDSGDDLVLTLLKQFDDGSWLVKPSRDEPFTELLAQVGRVPLPHYIRDGEMLPEDVTNYQTVFASTPGAVAAPTAGLHFTDELLTKIKSRDTRVAYATLHVGLGTFRPLSGDTLEEHQMHSEWCELNAVAVNQIQGQRDVGGRTVAVGTTVVRLLESSVDPETGSVSKFAGETDLFIKPGYQFQATDAMLTNFHLPKTTLLVMVMAFAGEELIREAYQEAIREEYRFYSFGDAMLII